MRVERRDARLRTGRVDPSVGDRAVARPRTCLTAGSLISIPMPAGTVTAPVDEDVEVCVHMQEDELVWLGVSPARTASSIGSAGAGHGAAPLAGVGAGGAAVVVAVLVPLPPPQPAARSRTRNGTQRLIRGTLSAVRWTGPTRRSEMTELATPPVERDQDSQAHQPLDRWPRRRRTVGAERAGLQPGARPADR